jgi:hypothetical protein
MRRRMRTKLSLNRETLRTLDRLRLQPVAAGMKDQSAIGTCGPVIVTYPSCGCMTTSCGETCITDNDPGCLTYSYDYC